MGDGAKLAALVVAGALLLSKCDDDPVTAAKVGVGAAGVAAGVAGGAAVGAGASGAARGLGKRVEDRVSGRARPSPSPSPTTTAVPNGPSRPLPPPVTSPMESDFDLCLALVDLPGCVVTP